MDYEAKDWEINPHLYLKDKDGNVVKNKDGTPRKKGGRPPKTAEDAARRTITRKQKNIQKLEQKLNNARKSFKKQKTTLEKLDNTKEGIVTESDLDSLSILSAAAGGRRDYTSLWSRRTHSSQSR